MVAGPVEPGGEGSGGVGGDIEGVTDCGHQMGADAFEEDGPDGEGCADLESGGVVVMSAEVEAALDIEEGGQGAGDEPEIVEMGMEEGGVCEGFEQPPVQGVGGAAGEAERVEQVAEAFQRRARMSRPNPSVMVSLSKIVMGWSIAGEGVGGEEQVVGDLLADRA
ncbi:MAG: hypothetical protein RI897_3932 [Verrucomicrobiota bacterium]|jgi:hypothetical protein